MQQTDPGVILGTMGYMSPEQVRGQSVGAPSDIFALGCLLYEMLTGNRAFARETAAETMTAILKDPAPEVTVSGVEVTPELNRIVAHCLEKNAGERFQSASDLAFHLRSLLGIRMGARGDTTLGRDATLKGDVPAQGSVPGQGGGVPSIVVLPFANLSPDPDQEYFCDGMTEEIIADLSKVRALRVISRTSAMKFKGTAKGVPEIARELNVRYVLEGSVRKAGNNLRITAQLIEAAGDEHLWADKYAGTLDDVFDLQEQLSRRIVEALKLHLTAEENRRLAKRPIPNVQAYDCCLRARRAIQQFTILGFDSAVQLLNDGLRIMGDNAILYAGLAYAHYMYVDMGVKPSNAIAEAKAHAEKALNLDPETAQAYLVLGIIEMAFSGNQAKSIGRFKQALAIDPNDYDTMAWLAFG